MRIIPETKLIINGPTKWRIYTAELYICKLDGEATLPQICFSSSSSFSSTIKRRQTGSCIELSAIERVSAGVRLVFICYPDPPPPLTPPPPTGTDISAA
jgi:hypothetical protein